VRSLRAQPYTALPGGSGITSAGTRTGTRGAPLDVGVVLAENPRSVGASSHETWPGPRLGDGTDCPGERAAVERRKAGGRAFRPQPHRRMRRMDKAPFGVPLPFSALVKRGGEEKKQSENLGLSRRGGNLKRPICTPRVKTQCENGRGLYERNLSPRPSGERSARVSATGEGDQTVQNYRGRLPLTRLAHCVRSAPSPHWGEGSRVGGGRGNGSKARTN
jgi:hypothetical protein